MLTITLQASGVRNNDLELEFESDYLEIGFLELMSMARAKLLQTEQAQTIAVKHGRSVGPRFRSRPAGKSMTSLLVRLRSWAIV